MALPAAAGAVIYASDMNDASYPGQWVAENQRTTSVGSITTTEILVQSLTFAVTAGYRYKVEGVQYAESTTALDNMAVKFRWANGGSVANTDTVITSGNPAAPVASKGLPTALFGTFVATVTGNVTVGAFVRRSGGAGTVSSVGGSEQYNTILVTRA
jgi:hypothetical protein